MKEGKKRERVVAELTYGHLMEIAKRAGQPMSKADAIRFLNQRGHANEIWRRMVAAGEDYLKESLPIRPSSWQHRSERDQQRLHYGE